MDVEKPQQYSGIVTKKLQLTKTVYHFFVSVDHPGFTFLPGQYATIIIDQQTRRQYSFAGAPGTQTVEFVVDIAPMGPGSLYFLNKGEGDRVAFLGPFGNFTLSETSLKKVFVATGTGIVPFRSMFLEEAYRSSLLVHRKDNNGVLSMNDEQQTPNVSLYWGLRYEDDRYWESELQAFAGQYTGFQYFLVLSKPTPQWSGMVGHVTDHVVQREDRPQNCEFYLCGNNAMIEEMKQQLSALHIPESQVKIDLFY